MVMGISLTQIVTVAFIAYIGHSLWSLYSLFQPVQCAPHSRNCLRPYLSRLPTPEMQLWVYSSQSQNPRISELTPVWNISDFQPSMELKIEINVSVPMKTRNNGTLYAHIYVAPPGKDPFYATWKRHQLGLLTSFAIPQAVTFQLVSESKEEETKISMPKDAKHDEPISHWRPILTISVMADGVMFDRSQIPSDLFQFLEITGDEYLPILYFDEMSYRAKDLMPLNKTARKMPLTIVYTPISYGKLRLFANMRESLEMLQRLGFTEKDSDEVKGLFTDTSLVFLLLTFLVAAFHLLFDFLAFKNDINYWRKKETMVGLSTKTVVWRCISTVVIFLYLMDEQTSLLVLIPAGIGSVIEIWKVLKAFKVKVTWSETFPSFVFGSSDDQEKQTQEIDSEAMRYLMYILYPLCGVGAIYSLLYTPHKSWYSWCINSLVNGVYAFGFIFMLPQLFINYKLKSVAHLPWRAFMYKAFNTFIDDIFAFIITMPTAHRLACFRDDIIFVIYLYQKWLYPVDKSRANEYGQSFGDSEQKKKE